MSIAANKQTALVAAVSALAGAALAAGFMTLASRRRQAAAEKQTEKQNIYESQRSLSEYLLFHFGSPQELLQWSFGPRDALSFPADLSTKALEFCEERKIECGRALDIGCAVGRTSFELSRVFGAVIGIDYSHSFVGAAQQLATGAQLKYDRFDEGDVSTPLGAM